MTPRDLIRGASESFRLAGIPDPEYDSALLLSSLCGRPPLALRLDAETETDPKTAGHFQALCTRRLRREPLQYILGETSFCGFVFRVDPRVLIPRPETELLCEWSREFIPAGRPVRVLDLCTGSGCLAVSLKLFCPDAVVTAADLSGDALKTQGLCTVFGRYLHGLRSTDAYGIFGNSLVYERQKAELVKEIEGIVRSCSVGTYRNIDALIKEPLYRCDAAGKLGI